MIGDCNERHQFYDVDYTSLSITNVIVSFSLFQRENALMSFLVDYIFFYNGSLFKFPFENEPLATK